MTKTIFKMIFKTPVKVLLIVLSAIFFACSIKAILSFFGVFGMQPFNLVLDVCGLALSVFFIVSNILTLTYSRYVVTNSSLYVRVGMFFYKIPCGLISSVVKISADGAIFILYTSPSAKPSQLKINITPENLDGFISALRSLNSNIVYEVYDPEQK